MSPLEASIWLLAIPALFFWAISHWPSGKA